MIKLGENTKVFQVKGITIIGNANNGLVIGLDEGGKKLIKAIQDSDEENIKILSEKEKELYETLISNGFINDKRYSRDSIDSVYLHVNSKCNLHCLGCYSYIDNRNSKEELKYDAWISIIDQLMEQNTENIVISGGEPFLREDLGAICRYIKNNSRIHLEVITNGTLEKEKYEKVIPYIDALNISIDGYDENTSFIRDSGIMKGVLENIIWLKGIVPVKLIATLHKKNIEYMKEYEKLAKKLNVFMSYSIFTADFQKEELRDYRFDESDFIKIGDNITDSENGIQIIDTPDLRVGLNYREGCGFGKRTLSIGYNADVYPCHMLQCKDCKMGNLKEQTLTEILEKPDFDVREISLENIEGCHKCEYKYLCGGACRGRAYLFQGDIKKKDPYCLAAKRFYDNFFKVLCQGNI